MIRKLPGSENIEYPLWTTLLVGLASGHVLYQKPLENCLY